MASDMHLSLPILVGGTMPESVQEEVNRNIHGIYINLLARQILLQQLAGKCSHWYTKSNHLQWQQNTNSLQQSFLKRFVSVTNIEFLIGDEFRGNGWGIGMFLYFLCCLRCSSGRQIISSFLCFIISVFCCFTTNFYIPYVICNH